MNNIDPNTGEVIPRGNSPRFQLWLAFFAFATIVMGSAVEVVSDTHCIDCRRVDRWQRFWHGEYHGTLLFLLLVLPQPLNRPQLRCPSTKSMIHLFWNNLCYTFDHKSTDTKSFMFGIRRKIRKRKPHRTVVGRCFARPFLLPRPEWSLRCT